MTANPSLDRRWIQVHGLPLDSLTATVRSALDLANSTQVADGAQRVVLFDADERPICAIDFAPQHFQHIQAARNDANGVNLTPKPGDTIIRAISAKEAAEIGDGRVYFDPTREVPPIDLPDYQPDDDDCDHALRARVIWAGLLIVALLAAIVTAKALGLFN